MAKKSNVSDILNKKLLLIQGLEEIKPEITRFKKKQTKQKANESISNKQV